MQVVSDEFHQISRGSVVPLSVAARVSFTKQRNTGIKWFTLDSSALDGGDLLAALDNNPTQVWDAYDWENVSHRLIGDVSVERSIQFPYNVQSAVADISLSNFDGHFTYADDGGVSPIAKYMLPKRPIRIYMGFEGAGNVPMFVGLNQGMPNYSDDGSTVSFTAIDFLSEIADQGLRNTIKLKDATTDKVIASILKQYGMTDDQFNFDTGQNTIPFVLFKKGDNAGTVLRQLVQAENGALWLDEQGVVRFTVRSGSLGKTPVMILDKTNIISMKPSRQDGVINKVNITSEVRVVQDSQPVFQMDNADGWSRPADDDQYRIRANRKLDVWLSLNDPAWRVFPLKIINKTNTSTIQFKNMSGGAVTSGVAVSGVLLQDSYKLTITNSRSQSISVAGIELWGDPARVVDTIEYEAYDADSIEKFGVKSLEISDNDFFGSYRNADLFATDILTKQANYSPSIDLSIIGNPALQLGDVVTLNYKYPGDYMITKLNTKMSLNGGLVTDITIKRHQVIMPFVLDQSQLDGPDLLA